MYLSPHSQQSQDDEEDQCDPEKLKRKAEIWWGLSDSSTNLAKALFPSDFITLSPSKDLSYFEQGEPPEIPPRDSPIEDTVDESVVLDTVDESVVLDTVDESVVLDTVDESVVLDTEKLITKEGSTTSPIASVCNLMF